YFVDFYGRDNIYGKTVLELGSGSGLTGIVLSRLGAEVIFTDYLDDALTLCKENAKLNNIDDITTLKCDWRNFPTIKEKIDIVIGSDLLYEDNLIVPLFITIQQFLESKIPVIISDPQRYGLDKFLSLIKKSGYTFIEIYRSNDTIPIKIFMIT
ncbi:MAG TPA: methyltransferase domain-containing protein, partial [Spirochaetota bacterium]|nr:methyltransferase domain-containing protein [Spirochaetota bacterium]